MKKLDHPLILGLLLLGLHVGLGPRAAAQELLVPPANDSGGASGFDVPIMGSGTGGGTFPNLELPVDPSTSSQAREMDPAAERISSGVLQPNIESLAEGDDFRIFDYHPAILESTGTWLRRGFWYTELDAVIMDRVWRRDNIVLAFQNNEAVGGVLGETGIAANLMSINGGHSGAEASPRLKLGRFLFRDDKNRDHSAEFIAYGGGQWSQSGRLDAVPDVGDGVLSVGSYTNLALESRINVSRLPMDNGNPSFDGATSMQYEYDSRMNNFELNYHIKGRMGKDRMELEPSGRWVRRAADSSSFSILAGLRYFDLNEDFDWDAFGIDDDNNAATAAQSGTYRVRTDNDLIGSQLGASWTVERARWSLGLNTKSGMYLNHTDVVNQFSVTGGVTEGDNQITVDNLSFILEGGVTGKVHIRPNFSLRTGLEIMYVSSIALAAEQMNFTPVSSTIVDSGSATYMGGSIGFEAYW